MVLPIHHQPKSESIPVHTRIFSKNNGSVALSITQKYLYIFSEFAEHIFEILDSKWAQTEHKIYKYSEYAITATAPLFFDNI